MKGNQQLINKVRNDILETLSHRIFYFKILFVVLGIFSALLILEIYTRVTYVKFHVPLECFQGDNVLNHSHVPGKTCPFVTREWNVIYGINSFGFRDGKRTLEKPANTFRILMLGDSFTEGWGVAQDKTFSALLENKLNSMNSGRFEVINMGVASYSPLLEYVQLKNIGLEFKPDLVILNFDHTDFADDWHYESLASYDKNHQPVAVRAVLPSDIEQFVRSVNEKDSINNLEKSSFLFRMMTHLKSTNGELMGGVLSEPSSGEFVLPERNLKLISDMLESKNIPFVFTLYPQKSHLESGGNTGYFSVLQNFGEQNEIKVLNLLPLFESYKNPNDLYFKYDMHSTEKFHELMVQGIYDYLAKNRLIGY